MRLKKEIEAADITAIISIAFFSAGICDAIFLLYCGFHPASFAEMPEFPFLVIVMAIVFGLHAWIELKKQFKFA